MKATLITIENEKDHAQAKALVEELMGSEDAAARARMVAQARLIDAYERVRWPRRTPALPDLLAYLMDQHGLSCADLVPLLGTPSRVSQVLNGKRDFEHLDGSQTSRALRHLSGSVDRTKAIAGTCGLATAARLGTSNSVP